MRPFFLLGSEIMLYRYVLDYLDSEGKEHVVYEMDMPNAEKTALQLRQENASNITISELDISDAAWLEGICVGDNMSMDEAERIWKMGEEEYKESINAPSNEDYLLDMEYRLSLLELGI